jgi:hypothetical protein
MRDDIRDALENADLCGVDTTFSLIGGKPKHHSVVYLQTLLKNILSEIDESMTIRELLEELNSSSAE